MKFMKMKKAVLLLCLTGLSAPALNAALTVKVRNVSNNAVATKVDFGTNLGIDSYRSAQQYLDIGYPVDGVQRTLRLYTNNTGFLGGGGDPSGMISTDNVKRIPMAWVSSATAPSGGIAFSSSSESVFLPIVDINDSQFDLKKDSAIVTQSTGGVTYVYLGARVSSGSPRGDYKAKLVVELVSSVSDAGVPRISHSPVSRVFFANRPLVFMCTIDEDVQLASSVFHYRMSGDVQYSSVSLVLTQNPRNPFQWFAQVSLPPGQVRLGPLNYYFEASDGFSHGFSGSSMTPHSTDILGEYASVSDPMPAGGGRITMSDGDARFGSTYLDMKSGCESGGVNMTSRKVNPMSLPGISGTPGLIIYEFHPERPCNFTKRAEIALKYDDENGDGIVDGTNIQVKDLKLYWWDNFEWRYIGGASEKNSRLVKAGLTHLSVFGLFAGVLDPDFRPREKIITPNGDGMNDIAVFDGLDGQPYYFTVKIMDIQGRQIRTLEQFGRWDGRDDQGNTVEGGVYLYQISLNEGFGGRTVSGLITVAK
jgi:gliding motility-associated-like protein